MNIWIVSAYDPLPVIDTDIRLLRYGLLADALVADGHSVVFWTSTFAHWRKKSRFERDTVKQIRPRFTAEFLYAPGYHSNVSLARVRHNRKLARGFARRAQLAVELPNVILGEIPCLELAEAAALFARRHGIPFVCDIQDIWPDVYLTWLPRWLHFAGRWFLFREYARLRRILTDVTSVTAVSHAYLDWARRWMKTALSETDRVFTLGYAMPSADTMARSLANRAGFLKRHDVRADQLVVVFLGQFATSYDVTTIVRAAGLLEKNSALPPYCIVLAGSGDKELLLRKMSAKIGSLKFTGWLEYADTITLLGASDIALAAYTKRAAQSLPYKPFEYMAFSLPVINSLPGELSEIIDKNGVGLNYRAESAESLAGAIAVLLSDADKRAQCALQAHTMYESAYNADTIYREMASHVVSMSERQRGKGSESILE